MLQGDLLGDQFADDQGQKRDGQDNDEQADGAAVGGDPGDSVELGGQFVRDGRPAESAGENADQGDAYLDGGKEPAGGVGQLQGDPGPLVAFFGPLLKPCLAGGNDGDLRHGEKAVGDDQGRNDEDLCTERVHFRVTVL